MKMMQHDMIFNKAFIPLPFGLGELTVGTNIKVSGIYSKKPPVDKGSRMVNRYATNTRGKDFRFYWYKPRIKPVMLGTTGLSHALEVSMWMRRRRGCTLREPRVSCKNKRVQSQSRSNRLHRKLPLILYAIGYNYTDCVVTICNMI